MAIGLLTQRCTIFKKVQTIGARNRPTYANENVAEDIRCKLDTTRIRNPEILQPGALKSVFRSMLYVETDVALSNDMKVLLDGITWDIQGINPVSNFRGHNHYELEIIREENN